MCLPLTPENCALLQLSLNSNHLFVKKRARVKQLKSARARKPTPTKPIERGTLSVYIKKTQFEISFVKSKGDNNQKGVNLTPIGYRPFPL